MQKHADRPSSPDFQQFALLGDRFGALANAVPLASFCKSFLDPIVVVLLLYLLAWPFAIVSNGILLIWATLAFLLTAQFLDGSFLFMPGPVRSWLGIGRLLAGWMFVTVALILVGRTTGLLSYFYPPFLLTWFVSAPVALIAVHAIFRVTLINKPGSKTSNRRVVIVGINHSSRLLADRIRENLELRMDFQGYFDDRTLERFENIDANEVKGRLCELRSYVQTNNIQQIYIALPMTSQPRVMALLDELQDSTASIYFLPDFFIFDLIQARVDHVAGIPVMAICESPFLGMAGLLKRFSDVVLALIILMLIWPVMLAVAIAVKITSQGPVLFKQRRYGADGESILVYKFRSMNVMEDGDVVKQAQRNDQRLTPIGQFIRQTSLDELPQFINVLQGRMSIVGPRPHANAHNEMYRKLIKGYMVRHKVKPGITGWAQVNGFRGETDSVEKMKARIDYDLDYLRNWSLWLDFKIVAKTVAVIFADKNAY